MCDVLVEHVLVLRIFVIFLHYIYCKPLLLYNYRGVNGSEAFPGPTDQVCGAAGADPDH